MIKRLFYITLFGLLLSSCEEYYTPDLKSVPPILVVESHLTNDPNQNFVNLSMTKSFYATEASVPVVGAKVELIQFKEGIIKGIETSTGNFTFPSTPVSGEKYQLRITYLKDIYESDQVVMPPVPEIDSLYTKNDVVKSYRTNSSGPPTLIETPGRQICIDAPLSSELEYYRFTWKAVLQWVYNPPAFGGPPPPSWYGWKTLYQTGQFNLAGPKEFSISDKVSQHEVFWLSYNNQIYLDSVQQIPSGWIVTVNQYGITQKSHDFYEQLNKQFSAEGSLFDPVQNQIYGNLICKTDPTKIVLGFFDLNSYRQYRYYLYLGTGPDNQVNQHRITTIYEIPGQGYEIGFHPVFWEYNQ